jgi:aryl-alcohol dehydrogenase-like predicted oxidoreductase
LQQTIFVAVGRMVPAGASGEDGGVTDIVELPGGAGLGTAPLGSGPGWYLDWGHVDDEEAVATVRAAIRAGVGWIDTAPFYGWGQAETITGAALSAQVTRPAVLTKCGTFRRPDGSSFEDHSDDAIRADVAASLGRLGVSSVDVLQLHDPDPATPVERAWETVCGLIAERKARGGGLSNHPVELMDRAAAIGPVTVVQHQFSLLHRAPETAGVLDWCASHGATFLAWSPLASGFLADDFEVDALGAGDFRRSLPWADQDRLDLARLRRELAGLAAEGWMTMAGLAVGWVLAKGARAIVGARSPAEARAITNFRPLPPDFAAAVEDVVRRAGRAG